MSSLLMTMKARSISGTLQGKYLNDELISACKAPNLVIAGKYNDQHSSNYQVLKGHRWRTQVERYSMSTVLGDLSEKRVIDLACGGGWMTRHIKRSLNAGEVVGTDLSPHMIAFARQKEEEDPLGISYRVQDAMTTDLPRESKFDVVTSNWLLNYAKGRTDLRKICRHMALKVRSGGKLVALVFNPDVYTWQEDPPHYGKYGFEVHLPERAEVGAAANISLLSNDGSDSLDLINYYIPMDMYLEELGNAGFIDLCVHDAVVEPRKDAAEDEEHFWNELLRKPIFVIIEGKKA